MGSMELNIVWRVFSFTCVSYVLQLKVKAFARPQLAFNENVANIPNLSGPEFSENEVGKVRFQ